MFAILGATGKLGGATVRALRAAGKPVRAIVRDPAAAPALEAIGCEIAIADLRDAVTLSLAFEGASFVQVMFAPGPRATDAAGQMRHSIENLTQALANTRPQAALAISDYGAEIPSGTGITQLFHQLEERLAALPLETVVLRSAEHMENWARVIGVTLATGRLPSLHHPLTKLFPTVSAADVGRISAQLLIQRENGGLEGRLFHAEGPRRYTPRDVADALTNLLGRPILAEALPRTAWHETMLKAGSSESAAALVTELYDAHNRGLIDAEADKGPVLRGTTELVDALRPLVPRS